MPSSCSLSKPPAVCTQCNECLASTSYIGFTYGRKRFVFCRHHSWFAAIRDGIGAFDKETSSARARAEHLAKLSKLPDAACGAHTRQCGWGPYKRGRTSHKGYLPR